MCPATGIARGVQPGRSVVYQAPPPPCGGEGCEVLSLNTPQVVQLSPRVNVSASGSGKVITSSQGGKFTFQVSTTAPLTMTNNSNHHPNPTSSNPASPLSNPSSQHQHGACLNQQQQVTAINSTSCSASPQQMVAPPTSRKPLPPARSAVAVPTNSSTARSLTLSPTANIIAARGIALSPTANSCTSSHNSTTNSSNACGRINDIVATNNGGGTVIIPPPLPPNKPILLSTTTSTTKKDAPISLELKPHKLGPQTLKFGITISKSPAALITNNINNSNLNSNSSSVAEVDVSTTAAEVLLEAVRLDPAPEVSAINNTFTNWLCCNLSLTLAYPFNIWAL